RTLRTLWHIAALLLLAAFAALAGPRAATAQSVLQQLVTPPAQQEAVAETPALSSDQTRLIADLLRDEAAREALIAELERLAEARAGEVTPVDGETSDASPAAP